MTQRKWAVDDIIEVPENAILREYGYVPNRTPTTKTTKKKAPARRQTAKQRAVAQAAYEIELPMLEPYLGHESLLVRTALIRSKKFPSSRYLPSVDHPERVAHLCYHMSVYDQEHMVAMAITGQNKVAAIHETAIGGRSSAQVAQLDLIKVPILTSSPAMAVIHNHPSGNPEASREDQIMKASLEDICNCIGVTLLDFVIVATEGWYSVAFDEGGKWDSGLIESMAYQRKGKS